MSNVDYSEHKPSRTAGTDAAKQAQREAIFKVMAYQVGPRAALAIQERASKAEQSTPSEAEAPPSRVAASGG